VLTEGETFSLSAVTFFGATGNATAFLEIRDYTGAGCLGELRGSKAMASLTPGQTVQLTFPDGLAVPWAGVATPNHWCLLARSEGAGFRVFRLMRKV
jgi:hypothetical protein